MGKIAEFEMEFSNLVKEMIARFENFHSAD
jgi:hypothetical protein